MEPLLAKRIWMADDLTIHIELDRGLDVRPWVFSIYTDGSVCLHEPEGGWRDKWLFLGEGEISKSLDDIRWVVGPTCELNNDDLLREVRRIIEETRLGRLWRNYVLERNQ
jgi:hypothetical protein